jgi:hypothetical protein
MAQPTIEELQAKLKEYEQRMGIGENDPAKEGYIVLVGILHQQNSYLKSISIKNMIVSDESGTKSKNEYERAKGLWEGLPKMIESVSNLKISLKMEGEEKRIYDKPLSAKDIANGQF